MGNGWREQGREAKGFVPLGSIRTEMLEDVETAW